jgi:peroxiredoxin
MQTVRSRFLWSLFLGVAASFDLTSSAHADNAPSRAKLGQKIDNVTFQQTGGKTVTLQDLQGKKATIVVFLSFECPVSKSYSEPLVQMAKAYPDVAFIGVSSNEDETAAQLARYAQEFKITFPVLKDNRHAAADAFQAAMTPEAFLLDKDRVLRYRGRIDNLYAARLRKNNLTTRQDLRQALDELLASKAIGEPATLVVGCPIPRSKQVASANAPITYHKDVLPILQNNCQICHRPGEVGPFSLMTYKQAVNWATEIKDFTQSRKMPPWKPVEGVAFHNERKLSDKDIATLAAWVDNGTPEGSPKDAPPPKQFPDSWYLGKPDLVLTAQEDFQLGATGGDLFRCFVLPTNLTEDKYVIASEIRPGNPRIVHHALTAIDTKGQGSKLEKVTREKSDAATDADYGPGYPVQMGFGFAPTEGGLNGWAPGQLGRYLPEGTCYFVPKGSDIIMQVHYHRNGRVEKDRCSIGLYFAKKPVERRLQSLVYSGTQGTLLGRRSPFFAIPAGAEHFKLQGTVWVDQDCTIYNVLPHMHKLGKEIKVTMTPPDGPSQTLVAIRDWDYNWQETYSFKEPIKVKPGTRFDVESFYDNSAANPNNPNNPPKIVTYGQQTTDEMCFVFLGATSDKPGRIRPRFEAPKKDAAEKSSENAKDAAPKPSDNQKGTAQKR